MRHQQSTEQRFVAITLATQEIVSVKIIGNDLAFHIDGRKRVRNGKVFIKELNTWVNLNEVVLINFRNASGELKSLEVSSRA